MPALRSGKKSRQGGAEKLFLGIVIALALVAGGGSWFAAAALSRHDQPHGFLPDKERALVAFSLTDETEFYEATYISCRRSRGTGQL